MLEVPRKPLPAIDAMLTILPERCLTISRAVRCMQKKSPRALIECIQSQSALGDVEEAEALGDASVVDQNIDAARIARRSCQPAR